MEVSILSYKKILIKREIPIYTDRDILLGKVLISTIFKGVDNYANTYKNCGNEKMIIKVSKKYRIRKANIYIHTEKIIKDNIRFLLAPSKIVVHNSGRVVRSHIITDILA